MNNIKANLSLISGNSALDDENDEGMVIYFKPFIIY